MRDRSRGRITRLSVFGYHYWPPGDNTIVVVGNHYGVESGVVRLTCDALNEILEDCFSDHRLTAMRNNWSYSPQSLLTEPGCEVLPECAENRLLLKSGTSWKSEN
jgi:hypothetical protein